MDILSQIFKIAGGLFAIMFVFVTMYRFKHDKYTIKETMDTAFWAIILLIIYHSH